MKSIVTNSKRGASLIVVLGLLVLLMFLLFSLTYLVLLEGQSGNMYGQQVQARNDADLASITAAGVAETATSATVTSSLNILSQATNLQTHTGVVEEVEDLSGKVNLNYVTDAEAFDRFVRAVLENPEENAKVSADVQNANEHLAAEIKSTADSAQSQSNAKAQTSTINGRVQPAYGRMLVSLLDQCRKIAKTQQMAGDETVSKEMAAKSLDENGEYIEVTDAGATPPMTVNADEPLLTLGDATHAIGNYPAPFSAEEMARLLPYVTTISQTPEVYSLESGATGDRMTLDRIPEDPIAVWQALATAFPDKNQRLLMQFAANVVDYFDDNTTPTIMYTDRNQSLANAVIGVEATALLTEVYGDSVVPSDKGDGGQFIEIYNPWAKSLSMPGWKMDIFELDGTAAGSVVISANVPPGGVLVVTDRFRGSEATGDGLYEIFGVRPDGNLYNVYEAAGLALPDFGGYVVLRNNHGDLIDVIGYGSSGRLNSTVSFQRSDPTVRVASASAATPFAVPALMDGGKRSFLNSMASMRAQYGDKGCSSPLDLLRVNSGFVDSSTQKVKFWQMPVYNADKAENNPLNFDHSVAELFVAGKPVVVEDTETSSVYTRGKLNVNTCSAKALLSLETRGADGQLIMTPQLWAQLSSQKANAADKGSNPYRCATDFVCSVIPKLTSAGDFNAARSLLDRITVSSASYAATNDSLNKNTKKSEVSGKQNLIILGGAGGSPCVSSASPEW